MPKDGDERTLKISLSKDQPHDCCLPGFVPQILVATSEKLFIGIKENYCQGKLIIRVNKENEPCLSHD